MVRPRAHTQTHARTYVMFPWCLTVPLHGCRWHGEPGWAGREDEAHQPGVGASTHFRGYHTHTHTHVLVVNLQTVTRQAAKCADLSSYYSCEMTLAQIFKAVFRLAAQISLPACTCWNLIVKHDWKMLKDQMLTTSVAVLRLDFFAVWHNRLTSHPGSCDCSMKHGHKQQPPPS